VTDTSQPPPRFHANFVNLAPTPYDAIITFIDFDPTALPEGQGEPSKPTIRAVAQVEMSLAAVKALIPLMVKMIADYEQNFGEIPAPGFDQLSKE